MSKAMTGLLLIGCVILAGMVILSINKPLPFNNYNTTIDNTQTIIKTEIINQTINTETVIEKQILNHSLMECLKTDQGNNITIFTCYPNDG